MNVLQCNEQTQDDNDCNYGGKIKQALTESIIKLQCNDVFNSP